MIGGFNFKLESKRLHYSFVLNRKITKIAGDSATGKSTLVSSVADSLNPRNKIQMTCEYQCSEISEVFTSILFQDIHSLKENYKNRVSYKKYHTAISMTIVFIFVTKLSATYQHMNLRLSVNLQIHFL